MLFHCVRHPRKLILVGYWVGPEAPGYPDPSRFVDPFWSPAEKERVIGYLTSGVPFLHYCGFSWCRFHCGETHMGTTELTDGRYYWPEGLAHYLEKHGIRLPRAFLDHVRKRRRIDPDRVRRRVGREPGALNTELDWEAASIQWSARDCVSESPNRMVLRVGERDIFWVALDERWWKEQERP